MTAPRLRKIVEKKRNGEIVGYMITVPREFVDILKRKNTRFVIATVEGDKLVVRPATPQEVAEYLQGW